jgi:3-oxoacyl-[acyl-carrier protein] reductase
MSNQPIPSPAKSAIVTGASRGIGRAIALRLAADGQAVAVNFVGQQAKAQEVVAEIQRAGGRAVAIQADVSQADDARRLFDEAEAALGPIGVLVNSAGVMAMLSTADGDPAAFDRLMAVNVRGTFNTMQQAARRFGPGGRVINMSSSVVGMKLPNYGPYAASKAAVEMLTRAMAEEMRGRQITVNAVAPGPTETELFFEGKSDELVERMRKLSPMERLGEPEDIAAVVAFLAGPDGAWINGQTLRVNGGTV